MSIATDTRFFDVWIIERNTVYQKVPFTVVADWTQEGRLLESDKVRPAGTQVWQKLVDHPLLNAYLPRPEPTHAEDDAEALQAVELDFPGKPKEAEDQDPDMIPLIDVSLVLLVFFMMTAESLISPSPAKNPPAKRAWTVEGRGAIFVTMLGEGAKTEYYVGESIDRGSPLTEDECLRQVVDEQKASRHAKVILQADRHLPYEKIQQLTMKLERAGVKRIQAKVTHVGSTGSTAEPGSDVK
jgi:biopolymer transport protein ExbD